MHEYNSTVGFAGQTAVLDFNFNEAFVFLHLKILI